MGILRHVGSPVPVPPAALEKLTFPNGAPLSPSLREWLAFDGSLVDWFADIDAPEFPRRDLGEVALVAYGDTPQARSFGAVVKTLPESALLMPRGKVARRVLYAGKTDSIGEYPMLGLDTDGPAFVCIEQPGFDVYLATLAGIVYPPRAVFGAYADDERYASRMAEHIQLTLGGRPSIKYGEDGFVDDPKNEVAPDATILLGPEDALPEGYYVVDEMVSPFQPVPMRLAAPIKAKS